MFHRISNNLFVWRQPARVRLLRIRCARCGCVLPEAVGILCFNCVKTVLGPNPVEKTQLEVDIAHFYSEFGGES